MKSVLNMRAFSKQMPIKAAGGLLLACIFCLTACQPLTATPPATLQAISLAYTPAVAAWRPVFSNCAAALPGIGLVTTELPANKIGGSTADVRLSAGVSAGLASPYAIVLGTDQVTVFVQSANPVTHLSLEDLSALFSGKTLSWDVLAAANGQKLPASLPVQVWSYTDGDEVRNFFYQAVHLNTIALATPSGPDGLVSYIAPDAEAMIQAIGQNPGAVGYALNSSLATSGLAKQVHPVILDAPANSLLSLNTVAALSSEPQGGLSQLLLCAQANRPS